MIISLFISGCLLSQSYPENQSPPEFIYTVDGQNYQSDATYPELNASLEWIGANTPEKAVISAWWDYGPSINAFGHRAAIAYTPSNETLSSVALVVAGKKWDETRKGKLSSNEKINDLALILITTQPRNASALMRKYGSEYVLVTSFEYGKSYWIYKMSGVEAQWNKDGAYQNNESIFYKMLQAQPIDGFEKVYSDSNAVIYKLK